MGILRDCSGQSDYPRTYRTGRAGLWDNTLATGRNAHDKDKCINMFGEHVHRYMLRM